MDYTGFPTVIAPMRSICNGCGFVISGVRASTIIDGQREHTRAVHLPPVASPLPNTPTSGTLQP